MPRINSPIECIYLHSILLFDLEFIHRKRKTQGERGKKKSKKEVFQCGNKNKFCVAFDLAHTFRLVNFFPNGKKFALVWRCLHRLSFRSCVERKYPNTKHFYMKCAAIREDFLSAITEPAKCMEIKQNKEQRKNGKKLQSPNACCDWIFICRYCAL